MKQKLEQMLNQPRSRYFHAVNDFFAVLTLFSIAGIVLETVPELGPYTPLFLVVEYVAVAFFTLEYLARLYIAPKKLRYIFSFFGLVDLFSILPTFVGMLNLTFLKSARVLRILRLLRMVRLAKLARFRGKVEDAEHHASIYWLNIQIYFTALFTTILALGALIYIVEAPAQGFQSIPEGMLWAADMVLGGSITGIVPQSLLGQLIGLLARFAGLALLGVLIHVIGTLLKRWLFGGKT